MIPRFESFVPFGLLSALVFASLGCGDGRKTLYPVTGEVFVDGKPAQDAFVYFIPVNEADPKVVHPFARVDENGAFAVTTYNTGDGAPSGDYVVTFKWPEASGMLKQNWDGPDRLKGKYADAKKKEFTVQIEAKETKLPRYDLTVK
jgi:hypothetical protein